MSTGDGNRAPRRPRGPAPFSGARAPAGPRGPGPPPRPAPRRKGWATPTPPRARRRVGEHGAAHGGGRVDPHEGPGPPEVAEGPRAVGASGPVRVLRVAQLGPSPQSQGALEPEAWEHAVEPGESHRGGQARGSSAPPGVAPRARRPGQEVPEGPGQPGARRVGRTEPAARHRRAGRGRPRAGRWRTRGRCAPRGGRPAARSRRSSRCAGARAQPDGVARKGEARGVGQEVGDARAGRTGGVLRATVPSSTATSTARAEQSLVTEAHGCARSSAPTDRDPVPFRPVRPAPRRRPRRPARVDTALRESMPSASVPPRPT